MEVYKDFIPHAKRQHSAVTFGNFDGMHLGHQQLLQAVIDAPEMSTVVLFDPLPEQWFQRDGFIRLMPLEKQIQFLKEKGIDRVLCLTFNDAFSRSSADSFIVNVLREMLMAKRIYVGQDACFGYRREGNTAFLEKESDIDVHVLSDWLDLGGVKISSTRCRDCLRKGSIVLLNELLNRNYSQIFSLDKTKPIKPFGGGDLFALEHKKQWELSEGVYAVYLRHLEKNISGLFWAHREEGQVAKCSILLLDRGVLNVNETCSFDLIFIDHLDKENRTHPFLKNNEKALRAFCAIYNQ